MKEWSNEVFARNLQRYMNIFGKNQKEIAEIAGVAPPTVNDWLKGKKMARINRVQKIADSFGIVKSDLLEEKVTTDIDKKNDIAVDIVVRLGGDNGFKNIVTKLMSDNDLVELVDLLCKLDSKQINDVKNMLRSLTK